MWLKSWAYATSPYGLGLTSEQSWKLTEREFQALSKVHAGYLAMVHNAPHFCHSDKRAFTPDDFLGGATRGNSQAELAALKGQMYMLSQKPAELESLGWAVGPYKGKLLKNG